MPKFVNLKKQICLDSDELTNIVLVLLSRLVICMWPIMHTIVGNPKLKFYTIPQTAINLMLST